MGSFSSKAFQEMLMEDVPPTPPEHRRHIDTDPRSPTLGIARTPIVVGVGAFSQGAFTPTHHKGLSNNIDCDPRSPTVGITRTPICLAAKSDAEREASTMVDYSFIMDPRSPTTEITRTPIQMEKTNTVPDPRSPTREISRTPLHDQKFHTSHSMPRLKPSALCKSLSDSGTPSSLNSSLGDIEPVDNSDNEAEELSATDRSLSEPDILLATEDMMLIKTPPVRKSLSAKKATPPSALKKLGKPKKLFVIGKGSDTPSKSCNKRSLSNPPSAVNKSPTPIKIAADGSVRSPLSTRNIDIDSPRLIMQRKQANKLGLLRRCSSTPGNQYVAYQDKENV